MDTTSGGGQDNCEDTTQDVSQDVQGWRVSQSKPSSASKKNKFQDQALLYFRKMVDNGAAMVDYFAKTNELLQKVDHQMDRLIEKL
jgi:hypothetical protein